MAYKSDADGAANIHCMSLTCGNMLSLSDISCDIALLSVGGELLGRVSLVSPSTKTLEILRELGDSLERDLAYMLGAHKLDKSPEQVSSADEEVDIVFPS